MFKTYEEIKETILSGIQELDKREGSFINDMISPVAMEIEAAHEQMKGILSKRFLVEETGEDLDKRADEYGLFRKQGSKSTGKVTVTGTNGTVILIGALFGTPSGLIYEAIAESIIVGTSVMVDIEAAEIGDLYNVASNVITEIPMAISGVTACTNELALTGGSLVETDESLQNRLIMRIRNPSTSGNASHYKEWALEVSGIGDAKVIPLKDGNGTVTVIPVTNDKRTPSLSLRQSVALNIELKRPVGASVTVLEATEKSINVIAEVEINPMFTLASVTESYNNKFSEYIKTSVFNVSNVDYYKCLSLFYEIEGVSQVTNFLLNGASVNISIAETEVQVMGTISIS